MTAGSEEEGPPPPQAPLRVAVRAKPAAQPSTGRGGGRSSLRRNLPGGAVVSEASGGRCACLRRKLPGR